MSKEKSKSENFIEVDGSCKPFIYSTGTLYFAFLFLESAHEEYFINYVFPSTPLLIYCVYFHYFVSCLCVFLLLQLTLGKMRDFMQNAVLGYIASQCFFTIPYIWVYCHVRNISYFSIHIFIVIILIFIAIFCLCNQFSLLKMQRSYDRLAPMIIVGVVNLMFANAISLVSGIVTIITVIFPIAVRVIYTNRRCCSLNLYTMLKQPFKKVSLCVGWNIDSYAILYNMVFIIIIVMSFCVCFTLLYFISYAKYPNIGFPTIKYIIIVMCIVVCILFWYIRNTASIINRYNPFFFRDNRTYKFCILPILWIIAMTMCVFYIIDINSTTYCGVTTTEWSIILTVLLFLDAVGVFAAMSCLHSLRNHLKRSIAKIIVSGNIADSDKVLIVMNDGIIYDVNEMDVYPVILHNWDIILLPLNQSLYQVLKCVDVKEIQVNGEVINRAEI